MPAIVAKRPKDQSSVEIVRGFLDSAIYYDLLDVWLTGFIGELEAGSDPVNAAARPLRNGISKASLGRSALTRMTLDSRASF
jgi:hypothetical protein